MVVTFHPLAVSRGRAGRSKAYGPRVATAVVGLLDALVVGLALAAAPRAGLGWRAAVVASVVALFLATGHYRSRIVLGVGRELRSLALCTALPFVGLCLMHPAGTTESRILVAGAVAVAGITAERTVVYWAIRRLRSRGWFVERTLVIGAGPVSAELATTLLEHPQYGLEPVAFVDDVDRTEGKSLVGLPIFRGVDHLRTIICDEQVARLIVAYGVTRDADMVDILRACEGTSVAVHVLPRFFELGLTVGTRQVDNVWGYQLMELRRPSLRCRTRLVKRAIDVAVAAMGLTIVSPLYAVLALAVKLSSRGPVHFRQMRLGQNEEPIDVLKFRTLPVNPRSDTEWTPEVQELPWVGRFLRASGLDELPQLWNILRGDMSLVGPRPERPFFVEKFKTEIPRYGDRHRVPVGLTGLAQVHGLRGDTPMDERARLDNQYIENWSLWQDVVILVLTLSAVVRNIVQSRSAVSRMAVAAHEAERRELIGVVDPGNALVG